MSYSRKLAARLIEPLAWLGKTNWITLTANGYRSSADLKAIINRSHRFGEAFAQNIQVIINLSLGLPTPGDSLFRETHTDALFIASKVLATGQKTVQLSKEWCEAFENTELSLQFKDYRQPFPTMVIEFPANYAESKFVPGEGQYPEFVVIHHDETENVIVFNLMLQQGQFTLPFSFRPDEEIEYVLKNNIKTKSSEEYAAIGVNIDGIESSVSHFLRIAMNAILAMIYGSEWEKLEPTTHEQQARKKFKTLTRAMDKNAATIAHLRLGTLPEYFVFDQKIKAFDEAKQGTNETSESGGSHKKTHWRRGHWRKQPIGPGRTLRKLTWIRPILINERQFKGDLKDTTTTYCS